MPKKTKAVYTITSTDDIQRDMIFTLQNTLGRSYIEAVNTRTGEYHEIPYKKEFDNDFIYKCEFFIAQHFGKHLIHYAMKSYQKGE